MESPTPIASEAYTEEYYRTGVEGHEAFARSGGRTVTPRMARALALADLKPGQRVLDIACGRGEIVLQCAMRGAYAIGIDYAQAAMSIAQRSISDANDAKAGLARMDATRAALRPGTFDVAFMLDFVEHVYQPDLELAFGEVARVLKPGGRLIVHTSPNRIYEGTVYRYYVRNVHRALLGVARLVRVKNRFFNQLVLPTKPMPPHDEFERELHINPQSRATLRDALARQGFSIRSVDHWEPPSGHFFAPELRMHNLGIALLDGVRFLRPLSRLPPLNSLFSNHIWVVAERR